MARTYTRDEWMDAIGEGMHVAFRKGTDHEESMDYWRLIQKMPDDLWNDVLRYTVSGLEYMEMIEVKDQEITVA